MNGRVLLIDNVYQEAVDRCINRDLKQMIIELYKMNEDELTEVLEQECEVYALFFKKMHMYTVSSYFEELGIRCRIHETFRPHWALIMLENYLNSLEFYYL